MAINKNSLGLNKKNTTALLISGLLLGLLYYLYANNGIKFLPHFEWIAIPLFAITLLGLIIIWLSIYGNITLLTVYDLITIIEVYSIFYFIYCIIDFVLNTVSTSGLQYFIAIIVVLMLKDIIVNLYQIKTKGKQFSASLKLVRDNSILHRLLVTL